MTSQFTITPTDPTSIKLEAGQDGTFSFTVNNLAAPDKSEDVILQALWIGPDGKGKEVDWLVVGPQRTLTITGGKTETVTITARPTPTTPVGEHGIQLAIADKDRPNDTFVYSKPVTCVITAKPVVNPPPRKFPKWLIPVIAGGVVVLGLGIFLVVKLVGNGDDPSLGKACDGTPGSCDDDLICAPDTRKCLLVGGATCKEGSACASGECVSRLEVCAVPLGLACNPGDRDVVPCPQQSACHPTRKICLGAVGARCTTDAQCETEKCTNNVCAIKAPPVNAGDPCETSSNCPSPLQCSATKHCAEQIGRPCTDNVQCLTGLCESGVCAEPKVGRVCTTDGICGQDQRCVEVLPNNKRCAWNPGHLCSGNAECTSQWCNNGTCSRDDGKCESQRDCPEPYLCVAARQKCLLEDGRRCDGNKECISGYCNANRCGPPPCNPPCRIGTVCNNENPAAPRCDRILIIRDTVEIYRPPFRLSPNN
jgi:hypothetical protein